MNHNSTLRTADIAIVGGGAAGLATAIFAARRDPQRRIVLFDGAKKLGAKILISGGGRCNVTNAVVTPADFCGGSPHVIRRVLQAFTVEQTVKFFREIGVSLHEEPNGKLFPDTNKARTVLDALLHEADSLGVQILTEHRVTQIKRAVDSFEVTSDDGTLSSRVVVLATGGLSVPKTGSDGTGYGISQSLGHSLVPRTPALVPLVLEGDFHAVLSGVSQDVGLTIRFEGLKPLRIKGSMLWTHFGVSGPVVLDASRYWHAARTENRAVTISVNFLPGDEFESADHRLLEIVSEQPRISLLKALSTLLPARVAAVMLERLDIRGALRLGQLAREERRRLVRALLDWPLSIRDSRGYPYAEVTAGGVPLAEINPATMESRKSPGLFLVGEILDVDGRIGGFNFQWAWSSAWIAGSAV